MISSYTNMNCVSGCLMVLAGVTGIEMTQQSAAVLNVVSSKTDVCAAAIDTL